MIEIIKIGESTAHDRNFMVNRPNGHPVWLLLLTRTPARFYTDSGWIDTPAGTAVLFRDGQRHLYGPAASCPEFPAYIDDWMHLRPSSPAVPEHFPFGTPVPLHNPDEYYSLFHLIHSEYYGVSNHRKQNLDHLVKVLLHKLGDESNTKEYPDLYYRLTALREAIYRQPQRQWTVSGMAASLHISEGYLHSLYKHFFDTTCISDVIDSRIQAAVELLTSTSDPVEQIAENCGYQNTEHFIRQFRKQMGQSPAKYRKEIRTLRAARSHGIILPESAPR